MPRRVLRSSHFLLPLAAAAAGVLTVATPGKAAEAQTPKPGGVIRIYQRDNPASASIHEEATYSTNIPFMGVFNNLVIFKQDVPQNSETSIVPGSKR